MATTKKGIHLSIDGNLTTTRYGGVIYASKHPNSVSEEEIATYQKYGEIILGRTPPFEIKELFKAGYLQVVHSIDNAIYFYAKDGI